MLEKVFENKTIRTVIKDDGIWFVAKDVALCLGYSDTNKLTRSLEDYERSTETIEICDPQNVGDTSESSFTGERFTPHYKARKTQEMTIINEAGLYHALFLSRHEEAKRFTKWVTTEVLPSIRKNGFYIKDNLTPNQVARLQQTASNYNALLKDKEYLERQVEQLDRKNDKLIEMIVQTVFKNNRR